MTVSGNKIKRTRAQLAIDAVLMVSACAPMAHRDGTVGGDSVAMVRVGDTARDAGDPAVALPLYQRAGTRCLGAASVLVVLGVREQQVAGLRAQHRHRRDGREGEIEDARVGAVDHQHRPLEKADGPLGDDGQG